MKKIIKIIPIFQEKIWGGDRLDKVFGYHIPSQHTGECWAISAHPGGDCPIDDAQFSGMTLSQLWNEHRDFFGDISGDVFPLLIKIIDAKEDLSIQVHPNDAYAFEHENGQLGKTECWYVLDCDDDATIIIGHNAATKEEMASMVENDQWDILLRQVPIRKGDFFQIDPGCLHAIKGGTMILETQQSSDLTYRFYDYGRLENGKPRQLHIQKSLEVTQAPFVEWQQQLQTTDIPGGTVTHLVSCPYYSVYRAEVNGKADFKWDHPFVNVSILEGCGKLDDMTVSKGDHLLISANYGDMSIEGNLELIYSHL